MSVDTYSICPCGSGKKIKFCKCKDSVSELDRVLTMVEGGQVVPALDRLSGILQEHPDAAWALAVRGRLLLDLREYGSLAENAERFIRLQPSNPLALTQRAAAKLFSGDVDEATGSMLEALTESGREVDAFVLDVASILAFTLAQSGAFLTARVYATLSMMASGYEGGQTAVTVLRQMNSAPTINQMLKSIPDTIRRPTDASWGERYDEAAALLNSNKISLAQTKFESLQRTVPGEPAILSGLLTCAIWRGDTEAQSDLLRKLSECESLDFQQRVHFLAMSALVRPGTPDIAVDVYKLEADIDDVEKVEMAMAADSRSLPLPSEMLGQMRVSEDDIPPRSGFQILDRDKPESLESLPPADQIPEAIAMVLVFGKQTDRAARVEVLDVREADVEAVRERAIAATDNAELQQELGEPLPLVLAAQPPIAMVRFKGKPAEAQAVQSELIVSRMPSALCSAKLKLLGGKSLDQLTDDESKLLQRNAVVRIIEQYDSIVSRGDEIIDEVYRISKLQPLPPIKPTNEQVETIENEDLNRIDPSGLNAESLLYLLQRAQQVSATPAIRRLARELVDAEVTDEQRPAKMVAYMALVRSAESPDQSLAELDQAKQFAEANNLSSASLLLSEVSLRLQAGDGEGFQRTLETLSTRYGNEPEVMAQLQQMLMAYGLIRPDGSPRTAAPADGAIAGAGVGAPGPLTDTVPAAAGGEAGLWTPDSGTAKPSGDSEGGSKLWVPGMD